MKKFSAKGATAVIIAVTVLFAAFLSGRYGWKLFGFSVCESAGIESVEVADDHVRIIGFYPGSFPKGFLGYHAEQEGGSLYAGFRFSGLFGVFETGDFDISIPVEGEITEVVIRTADGEHTVWQSPADTQDMSSDTENTAYEPGIHVLTERSDIYSLRWYFEHRNGSKANADGTPLRSDEYIPLDSGIAMTAAGLERPVPFMLSAADGGGRTVVQVNLFFDPMDPVLLITITESGEVLVNGKAEPPTEIPEAYEAIIGQYRTALDEAWSGQQLVDADLNFMVRDVAAETVGYSVDDLDGDGVPELAVGTLSDDDFYGRLIFELYTLDRNGNILTVFRSTERNRLYYAGGIRFANLGSSAFDDSFATTLKLEDGEMIDMTFTTDPDGYVQMELTPFVQ